MAPMSGWIKMRMCLIEDPRVQRIANACGISVDAVLGKLFRLWAWANTYAKDEFVEGYTATWVNVYVSQHGFAENLVKEGWLDTTPTGIRFVDFGKHNWKEGKEKALAANRKQRERSGVSRKCHAARVTKTSLPIPIPNTLSPLPSLSPDLEPAEEPCSAPPAGQTESEKPEPKKAPNQPPAAPTTPTSLRALPCDHPEAAAAAKRVVQHYQRVVRPATPPGGGTEAVLALLVSGQTEERLRACADRYAAWCSRHDREPRFREAARTFFGPRGQLEVFLEGDPDQAAPSTYTPPPRRAAPKEKPGQPVVLLRDLMAKSKPRPDDPANAVAQIEQEARSACEATTTPSEATEGSNGR